MVRRTHFTDRDVCGAEFRFWELRVSISIGLVHSDVESLRTGGDVVLMFCAGLERLDAKVLTGVVVLTVGTTLSAAYGEIDFKWIGVVMMVTSEFCEAIRMAVLQYLLGNLKFELIEDCIGSRRRV